jgi:YD repeat-containing protein
VDSTEKLRLVTETEYDSQGRAFRTWTNIRGREINGEILFNRQFAQSTTQIYDDLGRVVKTILPDGSFTQVTYDAWGQAIGETDALGKTKQNQFDRNGRLINVTLPAVPDPLDSDGDGNSNMDAPRFDYAYDWSGNQTVLQDALGRRTNFVFDSSGRQVSRTLPSGLTEQFTYNELGQPKTHQSFEGVITESIYDNAKTNVPETDPTYKVGTGRLVEQRYFAPNSYNNGFGTPTERLRFQYDAFGRKIKAEKFVGNTNTVSRTESWQYNDRGQLVVENKPEGVIKYEYDSVTGQKTAMMVVKATNENDALERTEYHYNELGWLTEVKVVEKNDIALATPELTRYGFGAAKGDAALFEIPGGESRSVAGVGWEVIVRHLANVG